MTKYKLLIIFILLFILPAKAGLNDTVGNWTLNEGTGSTAFDTSGYNNNGVITNGTYTSGAFAINGSAIYFNGSADINLGNSGIFNASRNFSISLWSKSASKSTTLIGKYDNAIDRRSYLISSSSAGKICITTSDDGTLSAGHAEQRCSSKITQDNAWHYIAFSFFEGYINIYIDGVNDTAATTPINGATNSIYMSNINLSVGAINLLSNTKSDFYTGYLDEIKVFNYTINETIVSEIYQEFQPILAYPTGGQIINATYPPQTTMVNFSWHDSEYPSDEIIVARDSNFNLIVIDEFVSSDYKLATLNSGFTYYWKVRQYNGTTGLYGNTSRVENFTISSATGASGQGIEGVVYELKSEMITPINGATVYIYNSTWSSSAQTGSNGYYLFSGLENGTYNIYSKKQGYDDAPQFPVTVNGSITRYDILMKIYISPYVPNFVFEKFIVRGLFDNSFPGVTVDVYVGSDASPSFTGLTDSMGQAVFQLIKDQYYRVTFTGGGIGNPVTIYVYAKEENYYVRILSGFPEIGDRNTDISSNLTVSPNNASWSNLSLIYSDTKSSTSIVWFYAKNLTTGEICYQSSALNTVTLICPVWSSGSYQFGFNATSSLYGFFQEDKIIDFDIGNPNIPKVDIKVDKTVLQWSSIILIVLTAALFSVKTVKFGAVIIPFEALIFWALGWFEPVAGNKGGSFLLLSIAVVIGIMIYLRASEIKVNY